MYFLNTAELDKKEIVPGGEARFIHTENMTIAHWIFKAGGSFPEHAHPHEQVVNMIEGEFELSVAGKTKKLKPGHAAVIPPDTLHSGKAVTACRIIDVFYPVREDYR